MQSMITWFEIPTDDFERGVRFYETVLGVGLRRNALGPLRMALFPRPHDDAVGGAVVHLAEGNRPGPGGTLVYLDGGADLAVPLGRVAAAGGAVVVPKTLINADIGWFAVFRDSEGNHVALHSRG